jgi:predicted secreted Zn-dependent protease
MSRTRPRSLAGAFCSMALACAAHAEPIPEPRVEEVVTTYEIRGTNARELTQQMITLGPAVDDGRRFAANTRWNVRWTYPYARNAHGCTTGPVRADVTVKIVLPHWIPVRTGLEAEWKRFSRALLEHEQGHRDIGVEAAREIAAALARIDAQPTCEALEELADSTGELLLQEARRRDKRYDRKTNHGESQGARMR